MKTLKESAEAVISSLKANTPIGGGWFATFPSDPIKGRIDYPIHAPILGEFIDVLGMPHICYLVCFSYNDNIAGVIIDAVVLRDSPELGGALLCQIPVKRFKPKSQKITIPLMPFL